MVGADELVTSLVPLLSFIVLLLLALFIAFEFKVLLALMIWFSLTLKVSIFVH
jgi:hypothetical protein